MRNPCFVSYACRLISIATAKLVWILLYVVGNVDASICIVGRQLLVTSHRGQQLEDRSGNAGLHSDEGSYQQWRLSDAGSGSVFITSHRRQQLEDRDGNVGLHSDKGSYQQWTLSDGGGGSVFITSHRGQQLEDRDGTVGLHADKESYQQWTMTTVWQGSNACQAISVAEDGGSDPSAADGVAMCLAGRLRALPRTVNLLRTNVLPALRSRRGEPADVFLYTPKPAGAEMAQLALLLESVGSVRDMRFDDEDMVLETLARDHRDVLKKAMRIKGNWLGSTGRELIIGSRDRRSGTNVFMMHAHNQCLEMIKSREQRRGIDYDRVVFTRTDLRWLFPHPPLSMLSPEFTWIPDSREDDWSGVYDKHIVMPRWLADPIFSGWKLLTSGEAYNMIVGLFPEAHIRGNDTDTERWLAVRLLHFGARVARYPQTSYVTCDVGKTVNVIDPRVPTGSVNQILCSEENDGRYPLELESVNAVVACLSVFQNWTQQALRHCYCPGDNPESPYYNHPEHFPDWYEICRSH